MSKLTSVVALGIGLAVFPVTAARAQVGGFGDAARGAGDAAKKGVVDSVLGTPVATVVTSPSPTSPTPTQSPTGLASPTYAASPGSTAVASPAAATDGMGRTLMDRAGEKAMGEAGKKMGPKLP